MLSSSPRTSMRPGELAEPFFAGEEIDDAAAHAVARLVEGAAAGRGEVEQAGERQVGNRATARLSTGTRRASALNE